MGVWNYVGVMQGVAATCDVGILAAAGRELPLLHGAGRHEEEALVRATAFWSRLAQSCLLAVGMLAWAGYAAAHGNRLALPVTAAAAALVPLSSCNEALVTFYQSQQRYATLGRCVIFGAIVSVVLLPLGAWLGSVRGLVAAAILAMALQVAQLIWRTRSEGLTIAWTWRWMDLKSLLGYGLPMRLVDYPLALLTLVDVVAVSRFLEASDLAIYATAKIVVAMAIDVPARMGAVYISRLFVQCGANTDRRVLGAELTRLLTLQYLVVVPLLVCGVWWCFSMLVSIFIPKYAESLPIAQVLLLTTFFVPQTSLMRNFWMIDKRFSALLAVNLVGLAALGTSLVIALAWRGLTLDAVAWGCVGGYAGFFLAKIVTIGREVLGASAAARIAACAFGGAFCTKLILELTPIRNYGGDLARFVGGALEQLVWTLVLVAPLVIFGAWQARLLELWRSFRAKT